uniref:Uncharacterized protein n=1 Tax=Rhizophora mucronata TaxID=61149 RepID=A0A2P2NCS1_RHIMU
MLVNQLILFDKVAEMTVMIFSWPIIAILVF